MKPHWFNEPARKLINLEKRLAAAKAGDGIECFVRRKMLEIRINAMRFAYGLPSPWDYSVRRARWQI